MKYLFGLVFSCVLLVSGMAFAGSPSDAVRYFYQNIGSETEPDNRDRFTDQALAALDANQRQANTGEAGCIDFILAIDGQDIDQNGIASTLNLTETLSGDNADVIADFSAFQEPRQVEWSLRNIGGEWKIADIASRANNWRLSQFKCDQ